MIDMFGGLFEFDTWGNRRIADAIDATPSLDPRAVALLAHILAAKEVWRRRLLGLDCTGFNPFPEQSLAEVRELIEQSARQWGECLATLDDARLDRPVAYRDLRGDQHATAMRDVLLQLHGHGIHHRAQINLLIRQAGGRPAPVDYLIYVRQ